MRRTGLSKEDPITVLDKEGKPVYQLGYLTNQGGSEFVVRTKMGLNSDFLTYTCENGGHDAHSDVDCADDSIAVYSSVYSQKEVFSVLN